MSSERVDFRGPIKMCSGCNPKKNGGLEYHLRCGDELVVSLQAPQMLDKCSKGS